MGMISGEESIEVENMIITLWNLHCSREISKNHGALTHFKTYFLLIIISFIKTFNGLHYNQNKIQITFH